MVALLSFSNNLLDQRASIILLFFASWVISCLWWWCDLNLRSLSVCFFALWALMQQSLVQQQHLYISIVSAPILQQNANIQARNAFCLCCPCCGIFISLQKDWHTREREREREREIKTVLDCTWSRLTINNRRSLWNVVLAAKDWRVQMKMMVGM